MPSERTSELLYDTASALRMVDAELNELAPRRSTSLPAEPPPPPVPSLEDVEKLLPLLPGMFVRAMGEVQSLLASIRTGREHIRAAATDRLAHSSEKLDEVSTATGKAALDIMHALERAIAKVDALDSEAVLANAHRSRAIRLEVKDDLFEVIGHMQFQDITSQQIMHVQSLLADMEQRLTDIAHLFDQHTTGHGSREPAPPRTRPAPRGPAFDEHATLTGADARQALADALVGKGRTGV